MSRKIYTFDAARVRLSENQAEIVTTQIDHASMTASVVVRFMNDGEQSGIETRTFKIEGVEELDFLDNLENALLTKLLGDGSLPAGVIGNAA